MPYRHIQADTMLLFCQHPLRKPAGQFQSPQCGARRPWEDAKATGFEMPDAMKAHEDVPDNLRQVAKYHPSKTDGHRRKVVMAEPQRKCDAGEICRRGSGHIVASRTGVLIQDETSSILPARRNCLLQNTIRTYTDEGDIVLDFAIGSGSTAVACRVDARFVGVEIDREIFGQRTKPYNHG